MLESLDLKYKCRKIYCYLEELEPREKMIISLRYGLFDTKPLTQNEVAKRLSISRSYVSRIEKKALQKLKKNFEMHDDEL